MQDSSSGHAGQVWFADTGHRQGRAGQTRRENNVNTPLLDIDMAEFVWFEDSMKRDNFVKLKDYLQELKFNDLNPYKKGGNDIEDEEK